MAESLVTLYCLAYGDPLENSFPVDIVSTKSIGHLKKIIREERPDVFGSTVAVHLKLWKVDVSITDNTRFQTLREYESVETAMQEALGGERLNNPTDEIWEVFN